ncbi:MULTISPECIES: molybdate ABC transporter permease subunit [Vibrio]|uniref:Molybdenum transport system permease n=1 Tax=Vibrio proteolyticus NBRC 13287 TaxID=1219065 RepID=U3BKY7_VIBPR|nr:MULTISPECIES: molybdate ABC transporter permease subunit [Vibrio]NAW56284.1 molybdate ABC transporter permease subunit [Vibrio sp. V36_P2S2PM302]NAX21408.1 molybdate ABC transporter permease subunit [Vibrio sp. V39_P1S14PM300]NAX27223.1 molybdate ABC transporter permease subunit [Vibrio sp. V38_P2S17PM301]NAX29705.1 molybdate ABC transporter permease subunit [Vibrio sp. V37_P2S8PM304]GAD67288.1 molybdate ABC transporter permease protein [Vibrio proteolyticus NBRC 13287]
MLSEYEYQALLLSLKVAFYAIVWLIPIGIALAWMLARKQFIGKGLLDSLIHLPLVLPPVVIGYLLLVLMGRQGILGAWLAEHFGLVFSFSWKGATLACIVVALPLMVRSIRLSLESVDTKLEQAAATLGASSWRVFMTITLPLTIPGIITGTMLSFARSLGEFGATISFVSNIPGETQTIPLAMYNFIETPGSELEAARLCAISIVIALASLLISEWMARRTAKRLGAVR